MTRQAPAEPYDKLVNISSCLTLFFFDTGRLVFTLYCYTVISWSIRDGDTEYCDRLLSNLIFSCFLNMMRQAPAEPYDTLVNTSSCLTLFFFDAGRLVFTLYYIYLCICSRKEFL